MPFLIEISNEPPLVELRFGEWGSFDSIRSQDLSINWTASRNRQSWASLAQVPSQLQRWYRCLVEEYNPRLFLADDGAVWDTVAGPDGKRWATKHVRFNGNLTFQWDFGIR